MQSLLGITLITIVADQVYSQEDQEHRGPQPCGGHLRGPVGTITTPNFPNPFPVPIKCKWIIEHQIVNGTISIYFTQQYTTSGLTFTEYMYYDETYKLGERKALTVTEQNITKIKWLQLSILLCEAAEKAKAYKYWGLGSEYEFVPFSVETLGPWGPTAISLFKEIAKRLVDITGDRRAGSYLGQRISLAIQRGNAASIFGTLPKGTPTNNK